MQIYFVQLRIAAVVQGDHLHGLVEGVGSIDLRVI
jgi:hypothetical protein